MALNEHSYPIKYIFADQGGSTTLVDPADILREVSPETLAAASPPGESNYRTADIQGVACAFCTKFRWHGHREEGDTVVPLGYCSQWEANVDGVYVCDRYADQGPGYDQNGNSVWPTNDFSDNEPVVYHEVHFAGSATAITSKGNRLKKGILRTGHWDVTPTPMGKLEKPLDIVRAGKSDPAKGIISMEEIVSNFKAKNGVKRVLVPFADKKNDDHIKDGNLAQVNTGFVEDLWIESDDDGVDHLMAEFTLTNQDAREKVLEGSVDDVSSGIPFHPTHGAFLEHVCLTPFPFIDGQKPWIAASDAPQSVKDAEVIHHVLSETAPEANEDQKVETTTEPQTVPTQVVLTYNQVTKLAAEALANKFGDPKGYTVQDASPSHVVISSEVADITWTAPYTVDKGELSLAPFTEWVEVEDSSEDVPPPAQDDVPGTDPNQPKKSELEEARELREMRLAASSQTTTATTHGGDPMTVITKAELEKLELSDAQRDIFQKLLDANAEAEAKSKTADVDARIEELKGYGFADRPGFLKLYRTIALSDDGGPAAVLLSDDGSNTKTPVTAQEILDKAIDALAGTEGKIEFSDQHTQSGNDQPPPKGDGPERSVTERAADAKAFLFPNGRN